MIIKKYIKGGLNSDVNPTLVPDGDYLNALNIRTQAGDDGKAGVVRPVPGHDKIAEIADDWVNNLDVSTQDIKHMCVDEVNGYAYAFISGGVTKPIPAQNISPKIVRVNLSTYAVDEIIMSSSISGAWEPDGDTTYLWNDMVEAKVVGDTLIWLNKHGYQFSLNVAAYLNTTPGEPGFTNANIDRRDISLVKAPPAFNLWIQKLEDNLYQGPNFIKDGVFQFAYRYTYAGYEQTVVSPWSIEVPLNDELDDYNYIKITIPSSEKIPSSAMHIDILCKNNMTGGINVIKRFSALDVDFVDKIVDHNNNVSPIHYDFYNDNIYESVDNAYFIKQFDTVPVTSYSMDVSKDRLFLSNNVEGYDTPQFIDISVNAVTGEVSGTRDIDYSLQTYDNVGVYDSFGNIVYEYFYWRNIMYIDGISQPGYYYVPGDLGPGYDSSYTYNDFSLSIPNPLYPFVCEIAQGSVDLLTSFTGMGPGCEIYIQGFSNSENNGYYVVESKTATTITAVKSDTTLIAPPTAEVSGASVTIILLSSLYGTDAGDLSNVPNPVNADFSDLIYLGSVPYATPTANYFINRDFLTYDPTDYSIYGDSTIVPSGFDVQISSLPTSLSRTFKSASRYNIGIQFYDFALRKCGVVTKTRTQEYDLVDISVSVPDRSHNTAPQTLISWGLLSGPQLEIPVWAKYYSIVRTDNLDKRYFIQGTVSGVQVRYVTKKTETQEWEITSGVATYSTAIAGISIDLETILNDGFGYIYEEANNDVVRLYKSGSDAQVLKIIGQQGRYIILEPKDINGGVALPSTAGYWDFEITRPYRQTDSEPFYEGSIYDIGNWGTAQRYYSVTTGSLSGDTFMNSNREYMNLRKEFRNLWFRNLGRACFIDPVGQVYRPSGIRWSNVFIPGSKVNGLSTFDALDYKDLPVELGPVNKLKTTSKAQSEGNVMLAIGQNYTASLYIGETSLVDNAGQTLLTTSGSVVGTVNVLRGRFGTTVPASVVEYDGNVYWADILNECIVRYSSNGLFSISDSGMRNFFRSYFKAKKSSINEYDITQSPYIYGGYNPATDEYILSFTPVVQSPDQYPDSSSVRHSDIKMMYKTGTPAKSIAYSVADERWTSFYSHGGPYIYFGGKMYNFVKSIYPAAPAGPAPIISTPIYSGGLFMFDKDSATNSFSGSTKDSFISIPYNEAPSNIKVFQAISIEGTTAPTTTYIETYVPNNQVTNLVAADFTNREDMLYSEIYRDRVSPNVTGTADEKMYKGDKMRGQHANISAIWSNPSNFEVRFINANIKDSIGHNKLSQ